MKPIIYRNSIIKALATLNMRDIDLAVDILYDCWKNRKRLFIAGNGGSAATASHLAVDLSKGIMCSAPSQDRGVDTYCLSDSAPSITAWSNDTRFDYSYSKVLEAYAKPGDCALFLSVSGNSPNIVNAAGCAARLGMNSIGLCGRGRGSLTLLVTLPIIVDSYDYGIVEDVHSSLGHAFLNGILEKIHASKNKS